MTIDHLITIAIQYYNLLILKMTFSSIVIYKIIIVAMYSFIIGIRYSCIFIEIK